MVNIYFLDNKEGAFSNGEKVWSAANGLSHHLKNSYWLVADAIITPCHHGDYPGSGKPHFEEPAYHFMRRIEREHAVILSSDELCRILKDTHRVENIALLYFLNDVQVDTQKFLNGIDIEYQFLNKLSDDRCICELRMFDEADNIMVVFLSKLEYLKDIVLEAFDAFHLEKQGEDIRKLREEKTRERVAQAGDGGEGQLA